jgi:hypothetical protein
MAITSPGGNALRNQEPGVVEAIRRQLCVVSLADIPTDSSHNFMWWLDTTTDRIADHVVAAPRISNRPWGTVRKALNLFLRSCICDVHLRAAFRLEAIEPWAEMPLDSLVAAALRKAASPGELSGWPGLKWLDKKRSDRFQLAAERMRKDRGLPARIYLDYQLWNEAVYPHDSTSSALPPENFSQRDTMMSA